MTLVSVMNRYHISIYHAAKILDLTECRVVECLLDTPPSGYLEEVFLYEREKHLS